MTVESTSKLVGRSVRRVEDDRLLVGRARFVDDIQPRDCLHAAFVRSPFAHARIVGIDVERALAIPGVVAVYTGETVQAATKPIQLVTDIPGYPTPEYFPLAVDKALFVGDPVAVVIAESRHIAEDGRDAVDVEYDPLPAVTTMEAAADPRSATVLDAVGSNLLYDSTEEYGDVDGAFAAADRVVRRTFSTARVTHVPMETQGVVASFDPGRDELTIEGSSQAPHLMRMLLAEILGHPPHRVHFVVPDIGGSFGQKYTISREIVTTCVATKLLQRPVKWIEDRLENLMSAGHAREETVEVAAAVMDDGRILAFDCTASFDHGAYPAAPLPLALFGVIARVVVTGPYRIPALRWNFRLFATNKASYLAYRGPWAIESLLREGIVDAIARELGVESSEIRRKNFIQLADQPTRLLTGPTMEGMCAADTFERAAVLIDIPAFRERQAAARADGTAARPRLRDVHRGGAGSPGLSARDRSAAVSTSVRPRSSSLVEALRS